jgi:hypothetical protein
LLGTKSHLLKGKAREDLIKVWWYRVDFASVRELEEGEIEEDGAAPEPPSSPRKESKKERKARLAKERDVRQVPTMKENEQQKQKSIGKSPSLAPSISQPATSAITSTPDQVLSSHIHRSPLPPTPPPAGPRFNPILGSHHPSQPWPYPFAQPQAQPFTDSSHPIPSSYPTTSMTAVGSSLASGARGGHDDSASIASSGGWSPPDRHSSRQTAAVASTSSKNVVVATTVGQADDLADYGEVDMEVDVDPTFDDLVTMSDPPRKSTLSTATQSHVYTKANAQPLQVAKPSVTSGRSAGKAPSKQDSRDQQLSQCQPCQTSTLGTPHSVVPSSISNDKPQQGFLPVSHTSVFYIPSKAPLNPVTDSSNASLPFAPCVTANSLQPGISVQNKLDERSSKTNLVAGNLAVPTGSHPASRPASTASVSVTPNSSSIGSVGQAMEENLRQLVFASKRARTSALQPHSSSSQLFSSISADVDMAPPVDNTGGKTSAINDTPNRPQMEGQNKVVNPNTVENPASAPSPATMPSASSNQSTADPSLFEDLAVSFITQTIEDMKGSNNNKQPDPPSLDLSSGSSLTSASVTPPSSTLPQANPSIFSFASASARSHAAAGDVVPDKRPVVSNSSSSANLTKLELSTKQRRLEKHLQESKSLMERISTAKTKQEKDLLLKIMSEKMRCVFPSANKFYDPLFVYMICSVFILPFCALLRTDG